MVAEDIVARHRFRMLHNPALDGIRALAVLMVVGFHAIAPGASGGYLGVDVFFVLSGFLITTLLVDEVDRTGTIRLRYFYLRRFLRLTPALVLMLIAYLLLAPLAWPNTAFHTDVRDVLISTFYLSDYASAFWSQPFYLRHTWSLAVEQHFYLLWPLVTLLIARRLGRRHFAITLAGLYVACTAWRIYCDLHGAFAYDHSYYRFDTRLSGLVVGSLLAVLLTGNRRPAWRHTEIAAMIALAAIALCSWRFHVLSTGAMIYGITIVELATLALIYLAITSKDSPVRRLLAHPVPSYVGRMSYGIYLWHYPIFVYLWGRYPWYAILLIGGSASLGLAIVSYYTVEKLARDYLRRAGVRERALASATCVATATPVRARAA
jgi:peptidoglycan/LPS O-acetylase OafA/YrhL